jgi:hypothetical protein
MNNLHQYTDLEKAGVSLAYAAAPTGTCYTTSNYPNRNATIPQATSSYVAPCQRP